MKLLLCLSLLLLQSRNIAQDIQKTYPFSAKIGRVDSHKYNFIGEYETALTMHKKEREKDLAKEAISLEDKAQEEKGAQMPASDYILSQVGDKQIVIINEVHENPRDRIFMESLLRALSQKGFTYLGLEALNAKDEERLNKDKYPTLFSGLYIAEPCFGNLVRSALKEGFYVFGYECTDIATENAAVNSYISSWNFRDSIQALNIKKVLDKDPKAKILLHCGYMHNQETTGTDFKTMAFMLKKMTGIDPYTIDQTILDESEINNAYTELKVHFSAVIMDSTNQPLVFHNWRSNMAAQKRILRNYGRDVLVIHPPTKFINERPDWLSKEGCRKAYILPAEIQEMLTYPCMLLAFNGNEPQNLAVPVDVIEIASSQSPKTLLLARGEYCLTIICQYGEEKSFSILQH